MSVYVIFRVQDPKVIQSALQEEFPDDYLQLQDDEWLVSASGSAKSVSDRIEAVTPNNNFGGTMICRISSYWGRAPNEVWDWISDKMEKSDG